ncbi:putative short-chain dehydrogenase [Biscogniauxia mediterranea]|nr:putative short-chain dehydrogenase [Biscogniauxia mediterranea]
MDPNNEALLKTGSRLAVAMKFTKTFRKTPYATISPDRPELSQVGKTVLITGGNQGIGFAIARSYIKASASKVIISGRRADAVATAAAELAGEASSGTQVEGRICDVSKPSDIKGLWEGFEKDGIVIDVLVLNAASLSVPKPILEAGTETIWYDYMVNTRAPLDFTERFYKQPTDKLKYLVGVSTMAIHDFDIAGTRAGYGLTKNAGSLVLQLIAKDTSPDKMQVVNFHPGGVYTNSARESGNDENSAAWDDVMLPGNFAVWAASPEARFLHGRFVWVNWDVDELKTGSIRERIDNDPDFLKIGVNGL